MLVHLCICVSVVSSFHALNCSVSVDAVCASVDVFGLSIPPTTGEPASKEQPLRLKWESTAHIKHIARSWPLLLWLVRGVSA